MGVNGYDRVMATSLVEAKRQEAVDKVLDATRILVGTKGLDVTMDEIAEAAGVSRRTLFRYFDTREKLVAAALLSGLRRYGEQLPVLDVERGLDGPSPEWEAWLEALCEAAHRMNARYGQGFWELATRADLPPEIAAAERQRRTARRGAMARITRGLWFAAGGVGDPPTELAEVVGAHLSPHFTAAVVTDVGAPWRRASELARAAIAAALERALASR